MEDVGRAACCSRGLSQSIDRDLVSSLLHRRATRPKASVKEFWDDIVPLVESPLRAVRLYESTRAPFALPPLRAHDPAYPQPPPATQVRAEQAHSATMYRFETMVSEVTSPFATAEAKRRLMRHLPAILVEEPLESAASDSSLVNAMVDLKNLLHHYYETKRDWIQRDPRHEAIRSLISCLRILPRDPRALDPESPRALLHLLVLSSIGSLLPPEFSPEVGQAMIEEGLIEALAPYVGGFACWMEQALATRTMSALAQSAYSTVAALVGTVALDACELFVLRHPEITSARGASNPFSAPMYNGFMTVSHLDVTGPELARVLQAWPSLRERRRQVTQIASEVIFSTTNICEREPRMSRTLLTPMRLAVARGLADSVGEESCASIRVLHACAAPTTPTCRARLALTSGTLEHVAVSTAYNLPVGAVTAVCAVLQRLHAAGMLSHEERHALLTGPIGGLLLGVALGPHREKCRLAVETVLEVASGLEAAGDTDAAALLALLGPQYGDGRGGGRVDSGASTRQSRAKGGDQDRYAAACAVIDAMPPALRLPLLACVRMIDVRALQGEALAKAGRASVLLPAMGALDKELPDCVTVFIQDSIEVLRAASYRFANKTPTQKDREALPLSEAAPTNAAAPASDTGAAPAGATAGTAETGQPFPKHVPCMCELQRCRPSAAAAAELARSGAASLADAQLEDAARKSISALWMSDVNGSDGQRTAARALAVLMEALAASGHAELALAPATALVMAFDPPGSGDPDSWELTGGTVAGDGPDDDDGSFENQRSPFPRRHEAMHVLGTASRVLAQVVLVKGWEGAPIVTRIALAAAEDSIKPLRVGNGVDTTSWYMGAPPALESRPDKLPAYIGVVGLLMGCVDQQLRRLRSDEMSPTSGLAIGGGERQSVVLRYLGAEFGRALLYAVLREAGKGGGGGKPLAAMAAGKATASWVRKLIKWLPEARLANAWWKARTLVKTVAMENLTAAPEAAGPTLRIRGEVEEHMNAHARRTLTRAYTPENNVWRRTMGWMPGTEALMRRERALVAVVYDEMLQRFGGHLVPHPPFPLDAPEADQTEAGQDE